MSYFVSRFGSNVGSKGAHMASTATQQISMS